jgi:hypothetical protein
MLTRPVSVGALLFLVSVLAGLLFAQAYPLPEVRNDSVEYLSLARNLAAGNGFTEDGVSPSVYRPPLFPYFLGGWYRLTGTSSTVSAAAFQSLLHAAGVLAAFLLFLEVVPSLAWAFAGALWLAVNPLLVTRSAFVLQEPTLLLFTTLAAWLSVRLVKAPSAPRAALAGSAWGLCTLAKVVAWFVPFLLLAMSFLPRRLRVESGKKEAAALVLCFAAVIAPWTMRNYIHFHRFIPVNGQGEGMLEWNVSHAEVPGELPGSEYAAEVYRKGAPEGERKAMLWKYVLDHPGYFFGNRILRSAIHFAAPSRDWWIVTGRAAIGEHGPAYCVLAALFHVPLYLLFLLRSVQWLRGRASTALGFLLLLYWAYWAQHAVLWGDPRFGLAVYPVLVGIAIAGVGPGRGAAFSSVRTPGPG